MSALKVKVFVTLKEGVLDPQGKAIERSLHNLGFPEITEVRQGKMIELTLTGTSRQEAYEKIEKMCDKLLVNGVVENYSFELVE
jgi:phosphoribosylformylglycinamidine synthase PurS subunit